MARTRLRKFEEELQSAIESGMHSYSGHTQWNFVNAVLYCLDLCTTIGERFRDENYDILCGLIEKFQFSISIYRD